MSNNLELSLVVENQNNKEATISTMGGELDAALTEAFDADFTSGNIVLTDTQFRRNIAFVSSNLSVARTITCPTIKKLFVVDNTTGTATLDVIVGSTSITMVIGEIATFFSDGTTNGLSLISNNNAAPFDVGSSFVGIPISLDPLMRYVFTRSVTFPAGLTGSQGLSLAPATAQADVDIQKNGVSVGTMRWAAAGTVATFIAASPIVMAAGDELRIIAPGTPDATLSDVFFTLAGTRGT